MQEVRIKVEDGIPLALACDLVAQFVGDNEIYYEKDYLSETSNKIATTTCK